jgi:RNA polymerase sigma-70 factor, ECF subfamily
LRFRSDAKDEQQLRQWVHAAIGGDKKAFEQIYTLYAAPIYRYCAYRVATPTEAEDLTAEVFLRAWQAIGQFKLNTAPFLAWLYRIAHNLIINYHSKMQNQREAADASFDDSFLEKITAEDLDSNPLDNSIRKVQNATLKLAFNRLPEEQRQVIYWRFIEELSHAEIATLIGKNEGTVRGIQYRALQALGKLLDKGVFVG